MDINSVNLTGRATKDTEARTTTSGKDVATISLAVNGFNEEVSYFDIVCWGKTAEIASKYVNKGKQIAVSGRLQQRKWQDKDGNNRYSVEVVASQVKLLGGQEPRDTVIDDIEDKPISLEDIPF